MGLASTMMALMVMTAQAAAAGDLRFEPHRVGTARSEACGVGDFNNDGKTDIIAGEFLYLAPGFEPTKVRTLKGEVDEAGKGYRWDFMNEPMDVDGDGHLDVVSCDWFQTHAVWYRNPGKGAGGEWAEHLIEKNGNFECGELADVDGDGKALEVVPAVQRTVWYEVKRSAGGPPEWVVHVVSETKHDFGVGVGDVNGDGRPDMVRPGAWYEAPADPRSGSWAEHPLLLGDRDQKKPQHTPQILVYDVNNDGKNDLITSSAHGYGIFWYEQIRDGDAISFKQHLIDDSWTQAHSLTLADLDGDGTPELLTGKRFQAHNGGDPEEDRPPIVVAYRLERGASPKWARQVLSDEKQGIGAALNVPVIDMDGDGDLDFVVTGKFGGPVWFENKGK
jgi:hypothetical protein